MTPEQFVYWMQGFAELNESPPSPEQWKSIREHLALVFEKEKPLFDPYDGSGIVRGIKARWRAAADEINNRGADCTKSSTL